MATCGAAVALRLSSCQREDPRVWKGPHELLSPDRDVVGAGLAPSFTPSVYECCGLAIHTFDDVSLIG